MMILSSDTVARLDAIQIDRCLHGIADWLMQRFTPLFDRLETTPHDVTRTVRRVQQWAAQRSLLRDKDVRMLCVMSLTQGTFFPTDPRFRASFDVAVRQFEMGPDARLIHIFNTFADWRKQVVGPLGCDGVLAQAARMIAELAPGRIDDPATLVARTLPAQVDWAGPARQAAFVQAAIDDARWRTNMSGVHAATHVVLATLLGYRWTEDPKLYRFRDILFQTPDPADMRDAMVAALAPKGA